MMRFLSFSSGITFTQSMNSLHYLTSCSSLNVFSSERISQASQSKHRTSFNIRLLTYNSIGMTFSKYPYPFASIFFSVSKCCSEKTQQFKDHTTSSVITAFWCQCCLCLFVQVLRGRKKTQQIKLQGRSQKKIATNAMSMVKFFSYLFRVLMMTTL